MEYRESALQLLDRTGHIIPTNGRVLGVDKFVSYAKRVAPDLYPSTNSHDLDRSIRSDLGYLHGICALDVTPSKLVRWGRLTPQFLKLAKQYR